jgi:hypothetical protein
MRCYPEAPKTPVGRSRQLSKTSVSDHTRHVRGPLALPLAIQPYRRMSSDRPLPKAEDVHMIVCDVDGACQDFEPSESMTHLV